MRDPERNPSGEDGGYQASAFVFVRLFHVYLLLSVSLSNLKMLCDCVMQRTAFTFRQCDREIEGERRRRE